MDRIRIVHIWVIKPPIMTRANICFQILPRSGDSFFETLSKRVQVQITNQQLKIRQAP